MFAYAWILDASSREMVWRMTINNTTGDWWGKWNRTFEEEVSFSKAASDSALENEAFSY